MQGQGGAGKMEVSLEIQRLENKFQISIIFFPYNDYNYHQWVNTLILSISDLRVKVLHFPTEHRGLFFPSKILQ